MNTYYEIEKGVRFCLCYFDHNVWYTLFI